MFVGPFQSHALVPEALVTGGLPNRRSIPSELFRAQEAQHGQPICWRHDHAFEIRLTQKSRTILAIGVANLEKAAILGGFACQLILR